MPSLPTRPGQRVVSFQVSSKTPLFPAAPSDYQPRLSPLDDHLEPLSLSAPRLYA